MLDAASTRSRRSSTRGSFAFRDDDEDIHMAIERRLTELVGPLGGKLHTARSRNDQVATDLALFVRAHAPRAIELIERADGRAARRSPRRHRDWPLPGYTHLQRAQPVYLGHHLLAYFWMLAARPRALPRSRATQAGELPLGAGALAGVNFDTDRDAVAAELGFERRRAELDRRRLQPRLRARLPRAPPRPARRTSRGSAPSSCSGRARSSASASSPTPSPRARSIMPQKKNPDAAELLRAKAPRVVGHLTRAATA